MIRIRCRVPGLVERHGDLQIRLLPSFPDCTIHEVSDDGSERELTGISEIHFSVKADGEPASVTLVCHDIELDVEGVEGT